MITETPRLDAVMKELGFERPNESYVYVRDENGLLIDYPYRIVFPIVTKNWCFTETLFDNPHVNLENLKIFINTTVRMAFAITRVKTNNLEHMVAMLTADYYQCEGDKVKHQEWVTKYENLTGLKYNN